MRHTFDLAALKAKNLPRCTFDVLMNACGWKFEPTAGALPEEAEAALTEVRAAVDRQVAPFIPPQKECIGCGSILVGNSVLEAYAVATFTYGLAYGEGHCSRCGYPARAIHRHPGDAVGMTFQRVLQYHPDELEERKPGEATAAP